MTTTAAATAELEAEPADLVEQARHYEELLERIRAVLRRVAPSEAVEVGPLRVDPRTRRVTLHGERVVLAQKEYELLLLLAREPDRVFTKQELLRSIWGYPGDLNNRRENPILGPWLKPSPSYRMAASPVWLDAIPKPRRAHPINAARLNSRQTLAG